MFLGLDWSGIHNRWLLEMRYEGSHECTNGMFLGLDWSGIHNRWLLEMRYEGSHECTNGIFLGLDWGKEGEPRVA